MNFFQNFVWKCSQNFKFLLIKKNFFFKNFYPWNFPYGSIWKKMSKKSTFFFQFANMDLTWILHKPATKLNIVKISFCFSFFSFFFHIFVYPQTISMPLAYKKNKLVEKQVDFLFLYFQAMALTYIVVHTLSLSLTQKSKYKSTAFGIVVCLLTFLIGPFARVHPLVHIYRHFWLSCLSSLFSLYSLFRSFLHKNTHFIHSLRCCCVQDKYKTW